MIGAWREQLARTMWPPAVVVSAVLGKDGPQVPFTEEQDAVGELGVAVSTNRSANQFAFGHRGGIVTVSVPASASMLSKAVSPGSVPPSVVSWSRRVLASAQTLSQISSL